MAKYKFKLESVKRVREARRDQERASLAQAFQAEQILAAKRNQIADEELGLQELRRSAADGRYLDVNKLLEAQRYELLLKAQAQQLAKQAVMLAAETERRRQILIEADRDVRAMELLDERHGLEHKRRTQRLETRQLDEVAANRRHDR